MHDFEDECTQDGYTDLSYPSPQMSNLATASAIQDHKTFSLRQKIFGPSF